MIRKLATALRKIWPEQVEPQRKNPRSRLRLEQLEDRTVPSTFNVTSLADDGPGTLRDAILEANDANPIQTHTINFVQSGTITLEDRLPKITAKVNIVGLGTTSTIISRDVDKENFRIFLVKSGAEVSIQNLTVTNGNTAFDGGGILNHGTLNLSSVNIVNNLAGESGGAIYNDGNLGLSNCIVSTNTAGEYGGGICSMWDYGNGHSPKPQPSAVITSSYILYNSATGGTVTRGGGIYVWGGQYAIYNSLVSLNSAQFGAGMDVDDGSIVTLDHTSVTCNVASVAGGGAYCPASDGSGRTLGLG